MPEWYDERREDRRNLDANERERRRYGDDDDLQSTYYGREFDELYYGLRYGGTERTGRPAFGRATGYGEPSENYPDPWLAPGPYTGRGPRGYRRSDDYIREDVCTHLTWHGDIDASDIEVRVQNGEVMLEGTVDSRQTKRLAEEVAESVPGVADVHNRLRIGQSGQERQEQL